MELGAHLRGDETFERFEQQQCLIQLKVYKKSPACKSVRCVSLKTFTFPGLAAANASDGEPIEQRHEQLRELEPARVGAAPELRAGVRVVGRRRMEQGEATERLTETEIQTLALRSERERFVQAEIESEE